MTRLVDASGRPLRQAEPEPGAVDVSPDWPAAKYRLRLVRSWAGYGAGTEIDAAPNLAKFLIRTHRGEIRGNEEASKR